VRKKVRFGPACVDIDRRLVPRKDLIHCPAVADSFLVERDLGLIRRLLLEVEECDGRSPIRGDQLAERVGSAGRTVNYHLKLAHDAGLIETAGRTPHYSSRDSDSVPDSVLVSCLTGKGHDFVAAVRDESRWRKFLKEKGPQLIGATLAAVLQSLATFLAA
jgi:hypothetical protein